MKREGGNRDSAFKATGKSSKSALDKRLSEIIDEIIEDKEHTGFAVFIDKNILPNQFTGLTKQLNGFKQRLKDQDIPSSRTLLLPLCKHASGDKGRKRQNMLSYNYLLQTYLR